jgi:type II secretory pathway component PulJ
MLAEGDRSLSQIWEATAPLRTILNETIAVLGKALRRAGENHRRKTDRYRLSGFFFHGTTPRTHWSRCFWDGQNVGQCIR